jgi:hypothetical protein
MKFTGNVWTMQISLVACLGRLSISYADLQSRHSAGFNSRAKGLGTRTFGKSWASLQRGRHIRSLQKLSPFLKDSCSGTTFSTCVSVMQILQKKKLHSDLDASFSLHDNHLNQQCTLESSRQNKRLTI